MSGDSQNSNKGFSGISSLVSDLMTEKQKNIESFKTQFKSSGEHDDQVRTGDNIDKNEKIKNGVLRRNKSFIDSVLTYSTIILSLLYFFYIILIDKSFDHKTILIFIGRNHIQTSLLLAALSIIAYKELNTGAVLDKITIPGIIVGLISTAIVDPGNFLNHFIASIGSGLLFLLIALGYQLLTGKEGMGGGIIKLVTMLGAFLGIADVAAVIILSFVIGIFGGALLVALSANKKVGLEFGLYVCFIGAIVAIIPIKNFINI